MRLLRLQEVEIGTQDRVFRHPRFRALLIWLAGLAGAIAMLVHAYVGHWIPGYIFGPPVLLFLLIYLRMVTARFHPSNWLVRMNRVSLGQAQAMLESLSPKGSAAR